jgi:hypothetical protein
MAEMRSANRAGKCLVFGVGRTYRGHHETDATDPKRACSQLAAATAKVLPTPLRPAAVC